MRFEKQPRKVGNRLVVEDVMVFYCEDCWPRTLTKPRRINRRLVS